MGLKEHKVYDLWRLYLHHISFAYLLVCQNYPFSLNTSAAKNSYNNVYHEPLQQLNWVGGLKKLQSLQSQQSLCDRVQILLSTTAAIATIANKTKYLGSTLWQGSDIAGGTLAI